MQEDGTEDDELILDVIRTAALSGAYRELARHYPGASGGFLKLADRHTGRVRALLEAVRLRADN